MIELIHATKYFMVKNHKRFILNDVTLTLPEATNIGILGRNGAGKSTLLRMLGGIDFPTSGTIRSKASFSWPMALSGGFQGSMTGRQNVKFVCRLYGKSKEEIDRSIEYVREFSELGDYFDMPIKNYSSGMKTRLSFGLSLAFDFDYLLIDETLSVGDQHFKDKAKKALYEKLDACNFLLVSHSMQHIQELCNACLLVDGGQLTYYSDVEEGIKHYNTINK